MSARQAPPPGRWRRVAWAAAAALLLLPIAATRLTDEVAWDAADVAALAMLLGGVLGAMELAARADTGGAYRWGVGVAVAAAALLFWVNAAVGILGSEDEPANRAFYAVHATALAGALAARLRPRGMARAMAGAAAAQVLVFAVAWAAGWGFAGPLTLVFTALWLTSARLFHAAA